MTKPFRVNGKKGAILQPEEFGRNEGGFYSVVNFEGTEQEVKNRAAAYDAIGALYRYKQLYGGRAKLDVYLTFANATQVENEIPVDVWELDPQESEKDLLDCDFPNSPFPPISQNDRKIIKAALESDDVVWLPGGDPHPEVNGDVLNLDDVNNPYSIYLLMRAGVRAFPIDAHVIRHTQTVSNRYAVQVSFLNVGRILSRASFIALEGVPDDLLFSVPTEPTVTQFIEDVGDLQYGWRKLRPQVQESAYQKRQIVTTYGFGLWPIKLFGTPI